MRSVAMVQLRKRTRTNYSDVVLVLKGISKSGTPASHLKPGCAAKKIMAMKPAVKPTVINVCPGLALATLTTRASKHQAVTSPAAAHARAIMPMRLFCIWQSVRMRASTGNAVTDIATPMKSANSVKGTPRVESTG